MWDLIVSVPDHCLSFYFNADRIVRNDRSHPRLSTLVDYAWLLGLYSISDNCVRESTLWLNG